jgi:SAM-dependent methyltransferase
MRHPEVRHGCRPNKKRGRSKQRQEIDRRDPAPRGPPRDADAVANNQEEWRSENKKQHQEKRGEERNQRHVLFYLGFARCIINLPQRKADYPKDMVTLRAFSTQAEAALAKSVLDDHNITSALADEASYLYGGAPLAMPVRLLVPEEQAEEAARILADGGRDRPDVEMRVEPQSVAPPSASTNPWELLALALLVALPGVVLLLQKYDLVLVAPYRRISRRAITIIPPNDAHLIGALVIAAALFLVALYFYLRRTATIGENGASLSGTRDGDVAAKIPTMSGQAPNSYSPHWFEFFHFGIAEERTQREIEFICATAPLPQFRRVLDVCCGTGRHARALAARGYAVTGVERDSAAVAHARQLAGGPEYIESDVRQFDPLAATYDVAIVMSQSFGYFDEATNRGLLRRLSGGLRDGGRIILDLWNPEFFIAHQGERNLETPAGIVREQKKVQSGRLFIHLIYPDGAEENFEWELFSPNQMGQLAKSIETTVVIACSGFDPAANPSPDNPRIQFVLERH